MSRRKRGRKTVRKFSLVAIRDYAHCLSSLLLHNWGRLWVEFLFNIFLWEYYCDKHKNSNYKNEPKRWWGDTTTHQLSLLPARNENFYLSHSLRAHRSVFMCKILAESQDVMQSSHSTDSLSTLDIHCRRHDPPTNNKSDSQLRYVSLIFHINKLRNFMIWTSARSFVRGRTILQCSQVELHHLEARRVRVKWNENATSNSSSRLHLPTL